MPAPIPIVGIFTDSVTFLARSLGIFSSTIPKAPASSIILASSRISSASRSEEHTSELQSLRHLVCRLLLEKKKKHNKILDTHDLHSRRQTLRRPAGDH